MNGLQLHCKQCFISNISKRPCMTAWPKTKCDTMRHWGRFRLFLCRTMALNLIGEKCQKKKTSLVVVRASKSSWLISHPTPLPRLWVRHLWVQPVDLFFLWRRWSHEIHPAMSRIVEVLRFCMVLSYNVMQIVNRQYGTSRTYYSIQYIL